MLAPLTRGITLLSSKRALPLDGFPATTAAYSEFQLLSSYKTGRTTNIRRTSDSAAADFATPNGRPDVAGQTAFLNATTGFATKWYDQSGNGNDISQGTSANQPAITLAALNGLPGIFFSGTAATKLTGSFAWAAGNAPWTVCMVVMAWTTGGTATTIQTILNYGTAANVNQAIEIDTKGTTDKYVAGFFTVGSATGAATFAPAALTLYFDGTNLNLNINGTLVSGAGITGGLSGTSLVVGDNLSSGNAGLTTLGELIMFPSSLSTTLVAAWQANARSRFGF